MDHARLPLAARGKLAGAPRRIGGGPRRRNSCSPCSTRPGSPRWWPPTATRSTSDPSCSGDRLTVSSVIESVSPEKHTGLGDGHFVTTRLEYTDQHGELVATMRFRILRFRPQTARPARPRPGPAPPSGDHPRHRLLLRGGAAGHAAHPALRGVRPASPPAPPGVRVVRVLRMGHRHLERARAPSTATSSCTTRRSPGFDYPLPIAVVELEEGTRLVADLIGVDPADVHIGMPVVAEMVAVDDELTIPMFRPVDTAAKSGADGLRLHRGAAGGVGGRGDDLRGHGGRRSRGARSRTPPTASTPPCGRSWPRPTSSAWPSPRSTAVRVWA